VPAVTVLPRKLATAALAIAFPLGPLLGLGAYRVAARQETARVLEEFDHHLAQRLLLLEHEVLANVEVLHGLAALHGGHGALRSEDFDAFATAAIARHLGMQALEWAPRVRQQDRRAHEREAQLQGIRDYRIRELAGDRVTRPAAARAEYFPVRLVAPLAGNQPALGLDLASEVRRREALRRAEVSEDAALSDPVALVQDSTGAGAFLVFVPVYLRPKGQPEDGRESLAGFAVGVFSAAHLVEHAMGGEPVAGRAATRVALLDEDESGGTEVVYASRDWNPADASARAGARERELLLGGQRWRLLAQPTETYLSERRTQQPAAIGAAVVLAWYPLLGLALALWSFVHGRGERKQATTLRSVLRSVSDGVLVADSEGRFLFANQAAQRIVGTGPYEPDPRRWSEAFGVYLPDAQTLCPPEQLPLWRAIRGEEVEQVDLFVRNPNLPEGIWLSVSGAPLLDEDGSLRGGVVAFRDVTARRRSEEVVQRLSSAVEQTADSVVITDLQGRIEYVNPAFESTTGYSRAEVLGRTPQVLKSGQHGPQFYREMWTRILAGEVFRGTVVNRKKTGELYFAEQSIAPIRDAAGRIIHFVSVVKDMTERRKREEQDAELRLASLVQARLYPQAAPEVPGFDIAGAVSSAATVCGDYLDYIVTPDRTLTIAIGDVCGHGLGPALVMAETRAYLRALLGAGLDLGATFREVHSALAADLDEQHYVTLLVAQIDPVGRRLRYRSAGHPPGFVLDDAGRVKAVLHSTGLPLGMLPDRGHADGQEHALEPGDLVVLVTDGVTDRQAADGSYFGSEGVLAVIRQEQRLPAREIVDRLRSAVSDFGDGQPQVDDIAMVLAKRV